MFGVFLTFVAVVISLLFILFVTVHRKTNFLVNLYWDNKYSDSDLKKKKKKIYFLYFRLQENRSNRKQTATT